MTIYWYWYRLVGGPINVAANIKDGSNSFYIKLDILVLCGCLVLILTVQYTTNAICCGKKPY